MTVFTLGLPPVSNAEPESSSVEMAKKKLEKASDHFLMEQIKDGEMEAFKLIMERYKDPLTNYIYRIIHDYDTAIDISQEVFIRVFRKAGSYQPLAAFSTWIFKIATNLAINELRRRKKAYTISIFTKLTDYENGDYEMQFADESAATPEEDSMQRQVQITVREALNTLPVKYRIPLLLRELEGYTYEEIAEVVGIPQGTVKSRINRGRSILKKKLKGIST